jgi:Flp pilus assembly protein CpaB
MSLILRQKLLSIIFIAVAVFGGIFIFWYINNLKSKNLESINCKEIFTAKADINLKQEITENLLEKQKIPLNIFNEKFITDLNQIKGKKAICNISKGEIISKDKIEGEALNENSYLKFSSYIPDGLRAVNVPVNYYGDVSVLRVGDKVDIISVYYDQTNSQLISEAVLSEKEIILTVNEQNGISNKNGENSSSNKNDSSLMDNVFDSNYASSAFSNSMIITFYLTPVEVEKIFLALERGVLNLSICSQNLKAGL